ncbi:class I SAM-dependent methyltransferase [Streptomyces paludis]|uniref:S-adenosyl-L-methionine-dependent methyltransferase n=1 Tax=Streptomyces paludis TaxID=2282738 RepID=A0A345HLE9_9ACTN|nr:class I SAM-dependent methyltransferase [Streptomyces paludis]AXG77523.1 SAM-dependent methyltransferase [Streptomyces paludis]
MTTDDHGQREPQREPYERDGQREPYEQPHEIPDNTAVRVALWRAMHVRVDPPPLVFEDEIGLRLADPAAGWEDRPDMDPGVTAGFRAAVVARARFVEDLLLQQVDDGVTQYVVLGAGLDTFAQRRPEIAARLRVFEIDQPGTQAWKRRRLIELGYGVPDGLRLVPVDFETAGENGEGGDDGEDREGGEGGEDWWEALTEAGFRPERPAVVACTGVTQYLGKDATAATLRRLAGLAPGSTLAMTFLLPAELLDAADRPLLEAVKPQARAAGTPFVSFYTPDEMLALARDAGFADPRHIPGTALADRYFADRTDGLRPSSGEDLLLATV